MVDSDRMVRGDRISLQARVEKELKNECLSSPSVSFDDACPVADHMVGKQQRPPAFVCWPEATAATKDHAGIGEATL